MKLALVLTTLLMTSHAFAFTCTYKRTGASEVLFDDVKITADVDGDDLVNVVAHIGDTTNDYSPEDQDGKAQRLTPDVYKRPSKYSKDFFRYDLSQMDNATDPRRSFEPGADCVENLHVPKALQPKFKAPLVVHCEQGGGTVWLTCEK